MSKNELAPFTIFNAFSFCMYFRRNEYYNWHASKYHRNAKITTRHAFASSRALQAASRCLQVLKISHPEIPHELVQSATLTTRPHFSAISSKKPESCPASKWDTDRLTFELQRSTKSQNMTFSGTINSAEKEYRAGPHPRVGKSVSVAI